MQQQFKGVNGESLPYKCELDLLRVEHVLQKFRDVWVPIETYPFLAVDITRVDEHCNEIDEFVVLSSGVLWQNMQPAEFGSRLIGLLMGGGTDAGTSPGASVFVEGIANPRAKHMWYPNNPFYIGGHPFAALSHQYIYINDNGSYQRTFAELITVDKHSRPRSEYVDFDPLADMALIFYKEYISGPCDTLRDIGPLGSLLDEIFVENSKIHAAAMQHHRKHAPLEKSFDYIAPILTRYGRLTHDATNQPRIEISFALLHYEKALRELHELKVAVRKHDTEKAFFHGVYCVVAVAACAEAISNRLVFLQTGKHPDYKDRRTPTEKINEAAAALAKAANKDFEPLKKGEPPYDELEKVRELRNTFMHATEQGEEVDPKTLTSTVFAKVDESHCRDYLRNLRLAVDHIYRQLAPHHGPPIVTQENVKWLENDLEIP